MVVAGGGAGGGAILVVASGTATLASTGVIRANGGIGRGSGNSRRSGDGSGGGIRIVAETLAGTGTLSALGTPATSSGLGRVRLEYRNLVRGGNDATVRTTPPASVTAGPEFPWADDIPKLFLGGDDGGADPTVRIARVSVGGNDPVEVPADPRASLGAEGADAVVPETDRVVVEVETTGVEPASTVRLRVQPLTGNYREFVLVRDETFEDPKNPTHYRWTVNAPVTLGYSVLQVRVVRP